MRMYAALNLGDGKYSAVEATRIVERAFKRYVDWTRGTNTVKSALEFLLCSDVTFGAFMWPLNSVVRRRSDRKLGVVTGYRSWSDGWRLTVKTAGGETNEPYDAVEDAQIPSELVEIAIGSRDTIKEKVHEKVEEAFA